MSHPTNPPSKDKTARLGVAALAASLLAVAFLPGASAAHVDPTAMPGPTNRTCSDLAPEGVDWLELKVDPPEDGLYADEDGTLVVFVDVDDDTKTFTWISSAPVDAVFVKAGRAGHNLYTYEEATFFDNDLTSPGAGTTNQISHISFCYVPWEPTCEDLPMMPECLPPCEEDPTMPGCLPTCEEEPDSPMCQPECQQPEFDPACVPTCENTPTMPGCTEVCVEATLLATANGDGSNDVTATYAGEFALWRSAGGAEPILLANATGELGYHDADTEVGVTYTYYLVAEEMACAMVEVTSIPDFPTTAGLAAAATVGLLGYAVMRRKDQA